MEKHNFNNGVTINLDINKEKGLSYWLDIKKRAEEEDKDLGKVFGHERKSFIFENIIEIAEGHLEELNKIK